MRWAIELSQYTIQFQPRVSIKGQAVADFVAELTPSEGSIEGTQPAPSLDTTPYWTLFVDGSSNQTGSGAGLILISPDPEKVELDYAPSTV